MKYKEFHSPFLKRTFRPDEPDYLKHYEAALIFELNFLNKQNCNCSGCITERKKIKVDLREIFNLEVDEIF